MIAFFKEQNSKFMLFNFENEFVCVCVCVY